MSSAPAQPRRSSQSRVWRALASPTRRRMLDLMRRQPRTTGELSEAFPGASRFAVMKHLKVLAGAGLVVARKDGRERWNHLNAVPIQKIYERWVKPYEAHWASGLLSLKRTVEGNPDMAKSAETCGIARVELEIPINAPMQRVWDAIVRDTAMWWPRDFYTDPRAMKMTLEPKVGGRLYEDWGEGRGRVWHTIVTFDPPHVLEMAGHLFPSFGGPAVSTIRIELVESAKGTVLQLSDATFGRVDAGTQKSLEEGWKLLFAAAFKAFVEK